MAGINTQALIESIGRKANPRTGNYGIKLRIQQDELQLREGMAAQVKLPVTGSRQVILVPRDAVVSRDRKQVVFLLEDSKASARAVTFGLPSSEFLPVVTGLEAGDILILKPLQFISDGTEVKAISTTATTPEAPANQKPSSSVNVEGKPLATAGEQ